MKSQSTRRESKKALKERLDNHIPSPRTVLYLDGKMYVRDSRGNYRVGNTLPAETLSSSEDAYKLLRYLETEEQEMFVVIVLDSKHAPISIHEMSRGLVNSNLVHPRETFKEAIRRNGTSIIVAHNHPSGSREASEADISTTERLVQSGKILGIPVLDHLIICKDGFTSIRRKYPHLFKE